MSRCLVVSFTSILHVVHVEAAVLAVKHVGQRRLNLLNVHYLIRVLASFLQLLGRGALLVSTKGREVLRLGELSLRRQIFDREWLELLSTCTSSHSLATRIQRLSYF